jgi:hypothetical protein
VAATNGDKKTGGFFEKRRESLENSKKKLSPRAAETN